MKRSLVWCAVVLMSLMAAAQTKDNKTGGTEQLIATLEQRWVDSEKASNPESLAVLLADNFVTTNSDGKVIDKAQRLANVKASKWETSQIADVKVRVYGNTAIATGNWTGKGTDENGKAIDSHEQWTDTWMKTNGKWQCIASHGSTIKM